jgi:hypothetical protein
MNFEKFHSMNHLICFISFLAVSVISFLSFNAEAQIYPLRSIDSIQYVHPDTLLTGRTLTRYLGDTVRVRGLVIFNPRDHALSLNWKGTYLVDTNGLGDNAWRGLLIRLTSLADSSATGFYNNFQPGNIVECTGIVSEYQDASANSGETQLNLLPVATQVVGFTASLPAPRPASVNQFMLFNPSNPSVPQTIQKLTGEPYEGMYVQLNNILVTGVSIFGGSRVSWLVRDASGAEMNVRDVSRYFRPPFISSTASLPPNPQAAVFVQQGKAFEYIRGVITETNFPNLYPRYEIVPLTPTDLGPVTASPPFVANMTANPMVPAVSQPVTVAARITDLDGSVASAKLFFAPGLSGTAYDSVSMTTVAVDSFSAVIPGSALSQNLAYIRYFIRAVDNQGNVAVSPDTVQRFGLIRIVNGGIVNVSQIQETPNANGRSIYDGSVLTGMNLRGRLMSTLSTSDYGRIIFQDGRSAFCGITVRPDNLGSTDIDTRLRGDSVRITSALVLEDFGITTLEVLAYEFLGSGQPYAPVQIPIDSVMARSYNFSEAYESMLIEFLNQFVVNQNPDAPSNFGEFLIYPDSISTAGLRVRGGVSLSSLDLGQNFNTDSLTFRQRLDYIRGILTYNFSNWKLQPRNRADVHGFGGGGGSSGFFERPVSMLNMRVYPNPASDYLLTEFELNQPDRIEMSLRDLTGRLISVNYLNFDSGIQTYRFALPAGIPAGMYLIHAKGTRMQSVARVLVNHN